MLTAKIYRHGINKKVQETIITGVSVSDLEKKADAWGAVRIEFAFGEVWRKIRTEWVVMENKMG